MNKAERFVRQVYESSHWQRHDYRMTDVFNAIYAKFGKGRGASFKVPPEYKRAVDLLEANDIH